MLLLQHHTYGAYSLTVVAAVAAAQNILCVDERNSRVDEELRVWRGVSKSALVCFHS